MSSWKYGNIYAYKSWHCNCLKYWKSLYQVTQLPFSSLRCCMKCWSKALESISEPGNTREDHKPSDARCHKLIFTWTKLIHFGKVIKFMIAFFHFYISIILFYNSFRLVRILPAFSITSSNIYNGTFRTFNAYINLTNHPLIHTSLFPQMVPLLCIHYSILYFLWEIRKK